SWFFDEGRASLSVQLGTSRSCCRLCDVFPHACFLDDNRREIVLLRSATCKIQDPSIELSDNFLRGQMAIGTDDLFQTVRTKLLPGGVLPLQEPVRNQQNQIARLHGYNLGPRGGQLRQNSERHVVSGEDLQLTVAIGVYEKWCVTSREQFQVVFSSSANGGN